MQVTDAMVAKALDAYNEALSELTEKSPEAPMSLDDIREAGLRAALTAALAEMWRPIEEAPKDGTEILIAGGTYYNSMSTFTDDLPFNGTALVRWDDYCREWRGENSGGHDEYFWHKPTHFMPLPAPPMGK